MPASLLDRRSEPDVRAVLEDQDQEAGRPTTRLGVALELIDTDADAGVASDAAASDAADTAADAADAANAHADAAASDAADTTADAADAGDAAAADAGDANATDDTTVNQAFTLLMTGDLTLKNGLYVLQVTGAYYGYAVTLVGWVRRLGGDEYEMLPGHCTVLRTGARDPNGLDRLASEGPGENYQCSDPSKGPELLHRLLVRRPKPANEAAWAALCPKPNGWVEE